MDLSYLSVNDKVFGVQKQSRRGRGGENRRLCCSFFDFSSTTATKQCLSLREQPKNELSSKNVLFRTHHLRLNKIIGEGEQSFYNIRAQHDFFLFLQESLVWYTVDTLAVVRLLQLKLVKVYILC